MKTKTKIILSIVSALFLHLVNSIFNFIYSPIIGQISAQQVNDSVSDYALAKFFRDGCFSECLFLIWASFILGVWLIGNKNNKK